MINYIRKDNEKLKSNVMKNKFSKCSFLTSKKIECLFNFMTWSFKWSLIVQDGNRLMATQCFLVVLLVVQDLNHLVATKWSLIV
jgi:hypothetical protein